MISKVDGVLWDLDRPLEGNAKLELLKFTDDEGDDTLDARMSQNSAARHRISLSFASLSSVAEKKIKCALVLDSPGFRIFMVGFSSDFAVPFLYFRHSQMIWQFQASIG